MVRPSASMASLRRRSAAAAARPLPGGRAAVSSGSSAMKAASSDSVPVCSRRSSGVPVASTWPASIATSQSKRVGLFHVGGGDDHAHAWALGADALDQIPELAPRERIDAGGRLVEDQQVGVVDQRAAQAELLLHAARELAGRARQERTAGRCCASARRCGGGARPRHGRTGGRRTAGSPRPTASGRGSCPGPAACRRCAGRRGCGAPPRPCRRRAPAPCPAAPRAHRPAATAGWTCPRRRVRSGRPCSPRASPA